MKFNLLQPKRIFLASIFCVNLFPLAGWAVTVQEVPNPRKEYGGWVTDMAGILNDETEAQINQMISELEVEKGTEMAVVTVPETSPATSPKTFATELFNYWGIGKQGQDNGVLFLISVGDRRVEIETGYGVEAILPDAKVGNIIDTQIIPRFKQGDFAGGTLAGTQALIAVLNSEQSISENQVVYPNTQISPHNTDSGILIVLAGGGVLAVVVGSAIYASRPRKISLAPEGYTRKSQGNYTFLCANCQQPMAKVDKQRIQFYLSQPAVTAQKLGSVKFEGWQCLSCTQKQTGDKFHLVAQESRSSRFQQCPHCQELTVTRQQRTIQSPTEYSSGRQLITDQCHCCSYRYQYEEIIPPLPPSSSSSDSYSSSDNNFGGGSSGGGGAGGSW
ncbi:YgcG family protein [Chroococcidiopsis sp. TS-821]|uniref:TPM domain-containing protein n=1 Tax=Chroococcidiopsis sp. TS-821 TaxID=1378066 RepID=UPI000CEF3CE4|nr:TPM domain-containing protein [Chroococcidiopsis sp. TS-821]PPS45759.1 hypothetical protein B1A85_05820 [Chroococcidiopsis sp. TS-821]